MLYSEQTQECVYELLNNDVTTSRVSQVIETVLKLATFVHILTFHHLTNNKVHFLLQ
jgi:hypothetical protein